MYVGIPNMFQDFYQKIQTAFEFHKIFIMQFNFRFILTIKINPFYSFKESCLNSYSSRVWRLLKKSVHVSTILVVWNTIHWRGENRVRQLCIFLGQEEYNRQGRRNRGGGRRAIAHPDFGRNRRKTFLFKRSSTYPRVYIYYIITGLRK